MVVIIKQSLVLLIIAFITKTEGRHLGEKSSEAQNFTRFYKNIHQMNYMAQRIFVDMFSLNQMFQNLLETVEMENSKSLMVKLITTMKALKQLLQKPLAESNDNGDDDSFYIDK